MECSREGRDGVITALQPTGSGVAVEQRHNQQQRHGVAALRHGQYLGAQPRATAADGTQQENEFCFLQGHASRVSAPVRIRAKTPRGGCTFVRGLSRRHGAREARRPVADKPQRQQLVCIYLPVADGSYMAVRSPGNARYGAAPLPLLDSARRTGGFFIAVDILRCTTVGNRNSTAAPNAFATCQAAVQSASFRLMSASAPRYREQVDNNE